MVEEAQAYLLHTGAVTEESLDVPSSVVNWLDRNTSGILLWEKIWRHRN